MKSFQKNGAAPSSKAKGGPVQIADGRHLGHVEQLVYAGLVATFGDELRDSIVIVVRIQDRRLARTIPVGSSAMRKLLAMLEAGDDGLVDIEQLLGRPVAVEVTHSGDWPRLQLIEAPAAWEEPPPEPLDLEVLFLDIEHMPKLSSPDEDKKRFNTIFMKLHTEARRALSSSKGVPNDGE